MTLVEHFYRMLLLLYPTRHRRAYGQQMLQHARDLNRAARQQGRWQVAGLCLRLLADGIVNAGIEHLEAIRMVNNRFKPVPWGSVLLVSLPGFLQALSRRSVLLPGPLLSILGLFYLGVLVLLLPVVWWRKRRFPVWGLLPAGMLVWFLIYFAGTGLSELVNALNILSKRIGMETGIASLQIVLAAVLFVILLRRQRVPTSFWLVIGIIVLGNVLLAALYSVRDGAVRLIPGVVRYFTGSGIGPMEGLMLVAAGLLAARRHGVLAILIVVGGYGYMCMDSDYLFGPTLREWTGLTPYLAGMTLLYLVVGPVALLRARTTMGRVVAVFVPVLTFHAARLAIPFWVIQQPLKVPWGDIILSINAALFVLLAWILYSHVGDASRSLQPDDRLEGVPVLNGS